MGSAASRERVSGGRAEGGTGAGAQEERRLKGPLRSRDALTPVPSKPLLPASPGYGSCAAAVPALVAALQGLRRALRHAARPAAAAASHRHPGRSPAAPSLGRWAEGGSAFGGAGAPRRRRSAPSCENPQAACRGSLSDGPSTLPTIPGLAAASDAARKRRAPPTPLKPNGRWLLDGPG